MPFVIQVLFFAELIFALWIAWHEGLLQTRGSIIASLAALAVSFVLRYALLHYETLDYIDWISRWVGYFREGGAWRHARSGHALQAHEEGVRPYGRIRCGHRPVLHDPHVGRGEQDVQSEVRGKR